MKTINIVKAGLVAAGVAASGSLFAAAPVLTTEVVVGKLELPWDMSFLKDGTMFFTEKCKGLSVRTPAGTINKLHAIGGISGYTSTSADLFCDGQAGMMGVEVDPDFDKNRFIYVYSSSKLNDKLANRLMRMKVMRHSPTCLTEPISFPMSTTNQKHPSTRLVDPVRTTAVVFASAHLTDLFT